MKNLTDTGTCHKYLNVLIHAYAIFNIFFLNLTPTYAISKVKLGACVEQQHGHLRITPPHGEMQRSVAVLVRVIHAGLVRVQKAADAVEVPSGTGNVQCRLALLEYFAKCII